MKKILVGISLLGAAFAAGCGSSGNGSSNNGAFTNCNSDTDCNGDVCNTVGHVCMHKCSTTSDCPSTEPTCAAVPGGTETACECTVSTSTSTCGGGSAYCNATDLLCEVTCSDNSGCSDFNPARSCTNGVCVGSVVDAGPTGCNNPATPCTAPQTCDTATGLCVAPASCGTANTQGNCAADQYCDGTTCQTPTACSLVSGSPATPNSNSPLIWGVAPTGSTRTDANCNANNNNVVQFKGFYLDEGNGSVVTGNSTSATYKVVSWVTTSGGYGGGASGNSYDNTVIIDSTTFTFELCSPSASTQAGVVLTDSSGDVSNVACLGD